MSNLVLDVHNGNPISSGLLQQSGADALIAKATEGSSFQDATLSSHRAAAKHVGVPFGSYLFLHDASKGSEADYYLSYAKPRKGDLQPIIDAEEQGLDGATVAQMASRVDACAHRLQAEGYRPILYADVSMWRQMVAAQPDLKRLRVWEAQYPGRFTRWFPRLAALRIRLRSGVTVVLWQWTDHYQVGARYFDASRLLAPLDSLLIPD